MRLSLMKAAHASVGGAPCRKSGYVAEKDGRSPSNDLSVPNRWKGSPKKLLPKRKILKGTGFSPYVNASIEVRL
jgi:hypothetical protein